MLKYLKLQNVGPAEEMELELGSRLNILTGDNGLGKSFLLDVAWYVYTHTWPADVNPKITSGLVLFPGPNDPLIHADIQHGETVWPQDFLLGPGRALMSFDGLNDHTQLAVYLMADGSCCVFDPYRNIPRNEAEMDQLPRSFVFSQSEILYGLFPYPADNKKDSLCEGLIRDWASWQKENGQAFEVLKKVLEKLSPDAANPIKPGKLTRIKILDSKDMPTVDFAGQEEVAIVHASSGLKRIVSLAYVLVWAWEEHLRAAKLRRWAPLQDILFLVDEIDAHLHPSWQRKIVPSLLEVAEALLHGMLISGLRDELKNASQTLELAKELRGKMNVQIITTTHSPLIMASLEPLFNAETDAWFDLDMVGENGHRRVELTKREFEKLGDASDWLTSDAFDLDSARSLEAEETLKEVELAMESPYFNYEKAKVLHDKLIKVLPADDTYFMRWRMIGKKEGWWK